VTGERLRAVLSAHRPMLSVALNDAGEPRAVAGWSCSCNQATFPEKVAGEPVDGDWHLEHLVEKILAADAPAPTAPSKTPLTRRELGSRFD
jgi:hypothetical protein